ncbi:asparagine synthetase B [Rapidithrix thailandica]|uniref:Asparagine synthetase B n=1 Tax=Rapidithrix thailandica TaxID=413964 RepID=A0AAW9SEE2_9BACT
MRTLLAKLLLGLGMLLLVLPLPAASLLIPMDVAQANHLKAYGVSYWVLHQEVDVEWLLNYRGGSFLCEYYKSFEEELLLRGVSYEIVSDAQTLKLKEQIKSPSSNMDIVKLEVPPKIAVYSPKTKQPWDDAVTLVLTYAEIPYDVVYDQEVLRDKLAEYDWLHLHHEDFTGQYCKLHRTFGSTNWYKAEKREAEALAKEFGFKKVSELKRAVAKKIKEYCVGGGFLFAMCSAADTYDLALAAEGVDICAPMYDGDAMDIHMNQKLNYENTFAFKDFQLVEDPLRVEFSNIDNQSFERNGITEENDYFKLFQFSAKWDPIPTMLTQNHASNIKGFMGLTTAFKKEFLKPEVIIMGETPEANEVRYIHGVIGKGTWTFYGGHDPEDYRHTLNEEPTDLNLHPNSPGYRLILNNVLFPAAKKKKKIT